MAIRDMIPWKRREPESEAGSALVGRQDPFLSFQQEMNRLFEDWMPGTGLVSFANLSKGLDTFQPSIDVVETEQEIRVSAELPGLDERDIDVKVSQNVLTISGEKSQEREERRQNYVRTERSYGSFSRSVPLHSQVDAGRAEAVFRKGVLTITLPKTGKGPGRTKISVRSQ